MFNHIKTDPELCIGCKTCMAACVASHTGKALFALTRQLRLYAARSRRLHVKNHQSRPVPAVSKTALPRRLSLSLHLPR